MGITARAFNAANTSCQPRVEVFSDVVPLVGHFLAGIPELSAEQLANKAYDEDQLTEILQFGLWRLEAIRFWDRDSIQQALFPRSEEHTSELQSRPHLV